MSRMRTGTKARHFMTGTIRHTDNETQALSSFHGREASGLVMGEGTVECGEGGGFNNKGGSYRNAGAGAGAGGRWTLHGNQRHSATGKRTPESKRQRRHEHNCSEAEKTQLNRDCWSSLVFPLSFSVIVDCLTTPRLFPLSVSCAHAQLPIACQSWLTICVLDINKTVATGNVTI